MVNVPAERNRDDVKMARRLYAEWLLDNQSELIYIDESGFYLWTSRTKGIELIVDNGQLELLAIGNDLIFL